MARGLLVEEFDLWVPGYGGATVFAYQIGTTTPASLFDDEAMTQPAANPQVLLANTDTASGIVSGKFVKSVYSSQAYYLDIATIQQTGARRPALSDLIGIDAGQALAVATGASVARGLGDHFADAINVADYGAFVISGGVGASPSTNTATLNAAIGAAAAAGGGVVILPAGAFEVVTIGIPGSVRLRGRGKGVTTLISKSTGNCFTVTGSFAALEDLTLDGVNLVAGSVGLTGFNVNYLTLANVEVKRFVTGALFRGGGQHRYRGLFLTNCTVNIRLLGDLNVSGGSNGGPFFGLVWEGGASTFSTDTAIELSQIDQPVSHCRISGVTVASNTGLTGGILLYGVQFITIDEGVFTGNVTNNLWLRDAANTALPAYQSVGVTISRGQMIGAAILLDGLAKNVILDALDLSGVTINLTTPQNPVLARDCVEAGTVLSGDTTKFERYATRNRGTELGVTTSATAVVAWQRALTPGQTLLVEASVVAYQINGVGYAAFQVAQAARQPGASLNYIAQTAAFTVGNSVRGQTSGATAIIQANANSGTSGTLTLANVTGVFQNGEQIKETGGGSGVASVNGTLSAANSALAGAMTTIHSNQTASGAWAVGFAVTGQYVQLTVTGAANVNVAWSVSVRETAVP